MLGQVIAAHESTVTLGTCKLLLSRVCSPVSRQFVGAGKLSITTFPTTAEGFFSCKENVRELNIIAETYLTF